MTNTWIREKVLHGDKSGRTIGYPTANLNPHQIDTEMEQGVYACLVRHEEKEYKGVLFYGPRLVKNETNIILEIYILDFDKDIYDKEIEFKILTFIRSVKHFDSMTELKEAIAHDIKIVLRLEKK